MAIAWVALLAQNLYIALLFALKSVRRSRTPVMTACGWLLGENFFDGISHASSHLIFPPPLFAARRLESLTLQPVSLCLCHWHVFGAPSNADAGIGALQQHQQYLRLFANAFLQIALAVITNDSHVEDKGWMRNSLPVKACITACLICISGFSVTCKSPCFLCLLKFILLISIPFVYFEKASNLKETTSRCVIAQFGNASSLFSFL